MKSAGPAEVNSISFTDSGAPVNDRIFSIVSQKSGQILSSKQYPRLSMIKTGIHEKQVYISCPGFPKMSLKISETFGDDINIEQICETRVCLRRIKMVNCSPKSTFSIGRFLDCPVKLLKIIESKDGLNLQMKSPLLLITSASIEWLLDRLRQNGQNKFTTEKLAQRFRANIYLKTDQAFIEENWKTLRIGNLVFSVNGNCTRCGAVSTDNLTGTRQNEPLKTLTQSRERATFGIYITPILTEKSYKIINLTDEIEILE